MSQVREPAVVGEGAHGIYCECMHRGEGRCEHMVITTCTVCSARLCDACDLDTDGDGYRMGVGICEDCFLARDEAELLLDAAVNAEAAPSGTLVDELIRTYYSPKEKWGGG